MAIPNDFANPRFKITSLEQEIRIQAAGPIDTTLNTISLYNEIVLKTENGFVQIASILKL